MRTTNAIATTIIKINLLIISYIYIYIYSLKLYCELNTYKLLTNTNQLFNRYDSKSAALTNAHTPIKAFLAWRGNLFTI